MLQPSASSGHDALQLQVRALLRPAAEQDAEKYLHAVTGQAKPCQYAKVCLAASAGKGRGVFATQEIMSGQQVLVDKPLEGMSQGNAVLCDNCFEVLQSVEYQLQQVLRIESQGALADRLDDEDLVPPGRYLIPRMVLCQHCSLGYCSDTCRQAAWDRHHAKLCPSAASETQEFLRTGFTKHAWKSNPSFLLAAKVVAGVMSRAERILAGRAEKPLDPKEAAWDALQQAWLPVAVAKRAIWWKLPVAVESIEEGRAVAQDRRKVAEQSLDKLRDILYDPRFPALFELDLYGSIMGMFELNNLDMVVPSPTQDYLLDALEVDPDMQNPLVAEILKVVGPDDIKSEGTAFYPIQSCLNHSCCPNARAFKHAGVNRDGCAVIEAMTDIKAGEEVTISYIEEAHDLATRRAALREYLFDCHCPRCDREEAGLGWKSPPACHPLNPSAAVSTPQDGPLPSEAGPARLETTRDAACEVPARKRERLDASVSAVSGDTSVERQPKRSSEGGG